MTNELPSNDIEAAAPQPASPPARRPYGRPELAQLGNVNGLTRGASVGPCLDANRRRLPNPETGEC